MLAYIAQAEGIATAERLDKILTLEEKTRGNVSKLLVEEGEIESRPYTVKGRTFSKTFTFV